jgi:hypothetical protein
MMKEFVIKTKKKGGKPMKRILLVMFLACLSIAMVYGSADAQVSGRCDGCHTMHNSQNGVSVNGQVDGRPHLLLNTCIVCHTDDVLIPQAPKIDELYSTSGGTMPASGTFDPSAGADTDAEMHNVLELNSLLDSLSTDGDLSLTPPGNGSALGTQLSCAGTNGCHGDHSVAGSDAAIKGFHHNTHATLQDSYRYLVYTDDISAGTSQTVISGTGEADWEEGGASASAHNLYSAGSGVDSISSFCGVCHGLFHGSGTDSNVWDGSNWTRHPTEEDVAALPGTSTVNYNENPFAFTDFSGKTTTAAGTYNDATGYVMCLSCHRAHGSDQPDLLRFDYANQDAGTTGVQSGCLGCHSGQRG